MAEYDPQEILDFWFGPPDDPEYGQSRKLWFEKSDDYDRLLAERFGDQVEAALAGRLNHWAQAGATADSALALVLLLDQLTRNIFRGTAKMYAGDQVALLTAKRMVDTGQDLQLIPVQRQFCYLPFEHAEDNAMQAESLRLFKLLEPFEATSGLLEWALKHAVIVERFGRFPHRNQILGRASTPEETEFLKQPGSGF